MSAIHTAPARRARRQGKILGAVFAVWTMASMMPVGSVSYTHLTLPTSDLV